jgi:hypothetical protein
MIYLTPELDQKWKMQELRDKHTPDTFLIILKAALLYELRQEDQRRETPER